MHEHEVNALNTECTSRSTDNAQGPSPYNLQFTPTARGSSPSTSECCLFFSSKSLHTDQIRSHYFGMLMIGCRSIQPPPFLLGLADVFVVNTEHVGNFITMYDVILLVKCWPLTADYLLEWSNNWVIIIRTSPCRQSIMPNGMHDYQLFVRLLTPSLMPRRESCSLIGLQSS